MAGKVAGSGTLPGQAGAQIAGVHGLGTVSVGVWNGIEGDVMATSTMPDRGPLFSARIEATPLGSFAMDENAGKGSPRIEVGVGATYRAASAYLPDGMSASRSRDLRAAPAIRVGWRGLYAVAEVLRRQATDALSMRSDVATGTYLQASCRFGAGKASSRCCE